MKNINRYIVCIALLLGAGKTMADSDVSFEALPPLENFQVNNDKMISAGLPNEAHFSVFKAQGVSTVIDLIPGDRKVEETIVSDLGLDYHNIQVEWENPTVANFAAYVAIMDAAKSEPGIVLTHCRKNWRGAVFTYLYRLTQLNEPEAEARRDLDAIWQPNDTWLVFIEKVKAHYNVD
ncbi:protein tyrosine phosphatase family protein [Alteromonas gilva]|uniref:Protein tyrosine phosphatase family protein n=1 Tax=Alteromonas gilva TaxID=2987522 RepID=A0ABT5KZS9_9ALTE|nr:protein tyrosine phosphatase family protein [Alteromonas gilva]MDC8830280.1 protein tyrosine phosphatase family protein [Alteromonas gilva]